MPRPPKKPKVESISTLATATAEPDESKPTPEPQAEEARPQKSKYSTFFQTIARIAKADWGTRAKIKVYRLFPIIDRLRGSEHKYLSIYFEPITEEKLKIDHGSGRYRLYLNYKAPAEGEKEIDSIEVDVMDMNFPPKVPPGEWVDDPRNKPWAWARPAGAGIQPTTAPQAPSAVDQAYGTVLEIQKQERERNASENGGKSDIEKVADVVTAVKGLLPAPAPATDNKMLDTVVALLTKQIDSSQKETQELRTEIFKLIGQQKNAPEKAGDNLETLIDKLDKIAPKLQTLLGLGGEKLTDVVHGRKRSIWEELAMQAIPSLAQGFAPVIPLIANRFLGPPTAGPGLNGTQQPATNGAQQPGQPQLPAAANDPMQALKIKVGNFLGANVAPMQKYFTAFVEGKREDPEDPESVIDGWTFASWIYEGHGPQILAEARQLGTATITQMFQASPYWTAIQPHAAKFAEFLDQVLRYEPPEPEAPGPVDLTKEPYQ